MEVDQKGEEERDIILKMCCWVREGRFGEEKKKTNNNLTRELRCGGLRLGCIYIY